MATITPRELSLLIYQDADSIEAADEAALFLLDEVDRLVLPRAGIAVGDTIPVAKEATVRRICMSVAARVWTNPQMLQRRSVGPLSRSWFESLVTGLGLRPDELEELAGLVPSTSTHGGLWTIPTATRHSPPPTVMVPYLVAGSPATTVEHGDPFPLYNTPPLDGG